MQISSPWVRHVSTCESIRKNMKAKNIAWEKSLTIMCAIMISIPEKIEK